MTERERNIFLITHWDQSDGDEREKVVFKLYPDGTSEIDPDLLERLAREYMEATEEKRQEWDKHGDMIGMFCALIWAGHLAGKDAAK